MAKDSYWFSHDYDPLGDPKMQAMVSEFGGLGYGIFWRIVEMLHAERTHKLPLKKFVFLAVANQLKTEVEFVENLVNRSINEFELFASDASFFWSGRVDRNITEKGSKKQKKSDAGKKGGINSGKSRRSKQNEAVLQENEATPSSDEANEPKERKGKESIESLSNQITTAIPENEIGSEVVLQAARKAWEDVGWREQTCMANYLSLEDLKQWMYMYNANLSASQISGFNPATYKRMLNGWIRTQLGKGYTLPERKNGTSNQLKTLS